MIPGIRVKISKPQKIPQTMGKHESKGFERKKKKDSPTRSDRIELPRIYRSENSV